MRKNRTEVEGGSRKGNPKKNSNNTIKPHGSVLGQDIAIHPFINFSSSILYTINSFSLSGISDTLVTCLGLAAPASSRPPCLGTRLHSDAGHCGGQ